MVFKPNITTNHAITYTNTMHWELQTRPSWEERYEQPYWVIYAVSNQSPEIIVEKNGKLLSDRGHLSAVPTPTRVFPLLYFY